MSHSYRGNGHIQRHQDNDNMTAGCGQGVMTTYEDPLGTMNFLRCQQLSVRGNPLTFLKQSTLNIYWQAPSCIFYRLELSSASFQHSSFCWWDLNQSKGLWLDAAQRK